MKIEKYYLPFSPASKVNYNLIITIYQQAEYNTESGCFDIIHYESIRKLSISTGISPATLNRIFSNAEYSIFWNIDKQKKNIQLLNNFKNNTGNNFRPFVVLTLKEIEKLKDAEPLMLKYYLYIKYYSNRNPENNNNFTAD